MAVAAPNMVAAPYTKRAPSMLMIDIRSLGALFGMKSKKVKG